MSSEYIQQEQEWLRDHYDMYREALEHLANPMWVRGFLRGIEDKLSPILSYNPVEHPPHVAIFAAGAVQAKLDGILTELDFIDEYEERRQDLDATIANAEPQGDGSHTGPPADPGQL